MISGYYGRRQEHSLNARGIETRLPGRYPTHRGSAFQLSNEEYNRRRHKAVPIVEVSKYNKRLLSKANIWYTSKVVPNGKFMICVLPEDLHKIIVKPHQKIEVETPQRQIFLR